MSELHNQYRPADFKQVIGQDGVCQSVARAITEGRSRAFLFSGPSGVGKTTIARIIAAKVNAEGMDLLEVDAATNTGIDQVRALQEALRFRSRKGHCRMVILDEAHMLTKAAWNSLLKVIEEPPPRVYWCLCTTELAKVPTTIRTRCLCYTLQPVSIELIHTLLKSVVKLEKMQTPDDVVYLCAEKAEGSPRRALTMLSSVAECTSRKEAALLLRAAADLPEVIDLCRLLAQGLDWARAMRILTAMADSGVNPEGVRIVVCDYFTKAVLGAKSPKAGQWHCAVLEAFGEPYPAGVSGLYPVILSVTSLLL